MAPDHTEPDAPPVALVGAGGHAAVVADAARAAGLTLAGWFDDDPNASLAGVLDRTASVPHLGPINAALDTDAALHVALGDIALRRSIIARFSARTAIAGPVVHPSAVVAPSATLAPGVFVGPRAVVNPRATIDAHAIINTAAVVEHDAHVGTNAHVAPGVVLCGDTRVGADTLVGANATVLPGVRVTDRCVVGAGSVVTRDIPNNTTAVGTPARALAGRRDPGG